MKYAIPAVMSVVAIAAGVLASSAFALPSLLVASGGSYPLHLQLNSKDKSQISDTGGSKLTAEGISLLLTAKEATSSPLFEATFLNVEERKAESKCDTPGDKEGEVSAKGKAHFVYTALSALSLGELLEPEEIVITCGTAKVKVRGSILAPVDGLASESVGTEEVKEAEEAADVAIGDTLHGEKGKPSDTKYYNNAGEEVKAKLESNFGSGFQEAAEEIEPELELTATEGKKFQIGNFPDLRFGVRWTVGGVHKVEMYASTGSIRIISVTAPNANTWYKTCTGMLVTFVSGCVAELSDPPFPSFFVEWMPD